MFAVDDAVIATVSPAIPDDGCEYAGGPLAVLRMLVVHQRIGRRRYLTGRVAVQVVQSVGPLPLVVKHVVPERGDDAGGSGAGERVNVQ